MYFSGETVDESDYAASHIPAEYVSECLGESGWISIRRIDYTYDRSEESADLVFPTKLPLVVMPSCRLETDQKAQKR